MNLLVCEMIHQLSQLRILAEEMSARVAAGLDGILLVIAVNRFLHAFDEQPALVRSEERIPVRPPNYLDNVPASALEHRFEFLNDLAVATYWAIQSLQVAVDHPYQVVEVLAGSQGKRPQRFGFVCLTVAKEAPDLGLFAFEETAGLKIPSKPRLVDRAQWPEPHGDRGKLPEIGHQVGMRVGREPTALRQFLPKVLKALFVNTSFEECACVDARGGVPLYIGHVTDEVTRARAQKVVERHFVKRGRGRVRGDVSTQTGRFAVGIYHHGHRIPANVALNATFQVAVARERRLTLDRNGVDIRCSYDLRCLSAVLAQRTRQSGKKAAGRAWALGAQSVLDNGLQIVQPVFFLAITWGNCSSRRCRLFFFGR